MNTLDLLTLIAYAALTIDLWLEIRRINVTKSSEDLSIPGLVIRFIAISVLMIKFVVIGNAALIIGQAVSISSLAVYVYFAVKYYLQERSIGHTYSTCGATIDCAHHPATTQS